MRARLTLAFFILALALGLTACGQKGPLVLPPASSMAEQP